ncbi:MAG: type II secretion system F family protein [Acidimicrobiales bacterium]
MTYGPVLLCGLCFGLGVAGIAMSWHSQGPGPQARALARGTAYARERFLHLALAGVSGVVVGLITGWPVAVLLAGVAVYGIPGLFGRTSGSVSITKIEAIASWTEMLQGTLAASAGLSQAIVATSPLSPPVIREATVRLSARLGSGMHPRDALIHYADELDDPCADRVVCALVLAASARAQRLGELLAVLADSTREEVGLRLRIETSRASVRSSVRTVLVFSIVFAGGLTLLGHRYLAPFGTGSGQVVLLLVGGLYATGLTLMVSLARPPAPIRLIGNRVATR